MRKISILQKFIWTLYTAIYGEQQLGSEEENVPLEMFSKYSVNYVQKETFLISDFILHESEHFSSYLLK